MDLVFETYAKLFAIRQLPAKKAVLVLFKDEAEYEANPGTPAGSGAYYDPNLPRAPVRCCSSPPIREARPTSSANGAPRNRPPAGI